jgi:hypothetical protein
MKVKPRLADVMVLNDSEDSILPAIDLANTSSPFNFGSMAQSHSYLTMCIWTMVSLHMCICTYMCLTSKSITTTWPPTHHVSRIEGLQMLDALKLTKFRKHSKSKLTSIFLIKYTSRMWPTFLYLSMVMSLLSCLHWVLRPPILMARGWMAWDTIYNSHIWCTTKTTNYQNDFGVTFWRFSYASHFECLNDQCNYLLRNGGHRNKSEWTCITPSPFCVGHGFGSASSVKLHYEVCHTIPTCIDVCGARVIYVHSITFGRLGIRGTHLKSSIQDIVDEVAPIKKKPPYGVEGRFIRMWRH